ncbi:MAG TPA: hypothetical protein VE422_15560 [Terriglobia bacterium]|nr:hypothetical protein [Terriglobia bacterium]
MQPPRIIFNIPDGRDQIDPSLESLRELVLNGGDEFWAYGSGQAALEFMGAEGGSRLLLMGLEAAGFFLIYEPSKGDDLCPINPSATAKEQDEVTVYVGGEPMKVPRRNFLDKATAWLVIADFLRDGQSSPRARWEAWL